MSSQIANKEHTEVASTLETIEALAGRGYLLALLSNADEDFLQSAVSCNRLRFSVIQSSESLRVYKQHRASFAVRIMDEGKSIPVEFRRATQPFLHAAQSLDVAISTPWVWQ